MSSRWLYILPGFFCLALLLDFVYRRPRIGSTAHLPGPPPGPWLVGDHSTSSTKHTLFTIIPSGNIPALFRPKNIGDADFAWTEAFGSWVRIKGLFGSDVLFTTDPKAFQHVLNTSCYAYPKTPQFRFLLSLLMDYGIVWAEGAQHSRHRKIMDSAFSYTSVRKHLPLIRQTAQRTVAKLRDIITQYGETSSTIDVSPWMARTTLDMLGATGFDYQFGALDEGSGSELYQAYNNLFVDTFLERSNSTFVFEELCGLLPPWALSLLLRMLPSKESKRAKKFLTVARDIARSLVARQLDLCAKGKEGGNDILINANLSAKQLTEEEILAQVTTLMVAGHETTASTATWVLYELSRHVEFQRQVRQEIKVARTRATQRGDVELSATDLDSLKYLSAVLKETLRYHPILPQLMRVAGHDDIIPLSSPLKTQTGELTTGIPVRKGQGILLSIAAFNRMSSVWGDDAHIWRPERFLENDKSYHKTGVGVMANIATFSSGTRNCLGWKFSMLELQALLVELIENFEFSPPPGDVEVIRAGAGVMSPMIKGSKIRRAELPLTVTVV